VNEVQNYILPGIVHTLVPESVPILQPSVQPEHIPFYVLPYVRPDLNVPFQVRRHVGYHLPAKDGFPPVFADFPVKDVPSYALPYIIPPVVYSPTTQAQAFVGDSLFHVRRPPGRGEKERKARVSDHQLGRALLRGAAHFTESLDALNVFYYSLPKSVRPRYKNTRFVLRHPTPQQKLAAVYRHADKLDLHALARGLTLEHFGDKLIGKASSDVRKSGLRFPSRIPDLT